MLNIVIKYDEKTIRFGDLDILDVFSYEGSLYMKIKSSVQCGNAIKLDGESTVLSIDSLTRVTPKKATLTIE